MQLRTFSFLASSLAFGLSALAHAQIAYTSFDVGQSYNGGRGWTIDGPTSSIGPSTQTVGCEFTSGLTGNLSNLTVAASSVNGPAGVNVLLYSDNGGTIGSVLESWNLSSLPSFGSAFTPEVLASTPGVSLTAGSSYWVVLSPIADDTWAVWNQSTVASGNIGFSNDGGATFGYSSDVDGAFSVQVTPEPSSFLALGLGILPLLALRRKRSA